MKNDHTRLPRGRVRGWSMAATRRNTRFLYSVREDQLTGNGYAVTLTLRDCPDSAQDWHKLRTAWIKRMRRLGMSRLHWVTEWQRRGVPHLHGAIWFSPSAAAKAKDQRAFDAWAANAIISSWLMVAGASLSWRAQHVRRIDGAVGWFQYLSKHAARGVNHYQRSSASIPAGWSGTTGRVWGHCGDWPVIEERRLVLESHYSDGDGGFYAFRRLVRSWRVSDARGESDPDIRRRRMLQARRMLQHPERRVSAVRGISEWIPEHLAVCMATNLAARGFRGSLD